MRRSISAGLACWGSGAGADRIRSLGRRLGPAAPGRPVRRARTGARTRGQNALWRTPRDNHCVYHAEDEDIIRKHAEISGFPATKITEVRKTIDPTTEQSD